MLQPRLSRDLAHHRTPAGIPPRKSDPGTRGGAGSAGERGGGASPRRRASARRRGAGLPGPVARRCHCPARPRVSACAHAPCAGSCSERRSPVFGVPVPRAGGGCDGRRVSRVLARVGAGPSEGRPAGEEGLSAGKSRKRVLGWRLSYLRPRGPDWDTGLQPRDPDRHPLPGPTRLPGRARGPTLSGSRWRRCCVEGRVAREDLGPAGALGALDAGARHYPAAAPSGGL